MITTTITAISLAVAIGLGTVAYGVLRGFNTKPRAAHKEGIELTDKKANREVMCLRELFHDELNPSIFLNRWRAKNCDEKKLERLSKHPGALRRIVESRKDIFRDQGINTTTETWEKEYKGNKKNKVKMRIKVDEPSRTAGISAGKIKK